MQKPWTVFSVSNNTLSPPEQSDTFETTSGTQFWHCSLRDWRIERVNLEVGSDIKSWSFDTQVWEALALRPLLEPLLSVGSLFTLSFVFLDLYPKTSPPFLSIAVPPAISSPSDLMQLFHAEQQIFPREALNKLSACKNPSAWEILSICFRDISPSCLSSVTSNFSLHFTHENSRWLVTNISFAFWISFSARSRLCFLR